LFEFGMFLGFLEFIGRKWSADVGGDFKSKPMISTNLGTPTRVQKPPNYNDSSIKRT
jgi:hypothetical protein